MPKSLLPKQIGFFVLLVVIILFALTSLIIFGQDARVSAAQQGTIVTLIPPDQAYPGELITVKLVVNNAQNLAGYQGTLRYDVTNLGRVGIIPESGLSLTGRDMIPLRPVWREDSVIFGAATCPVADCTDSQYNSAPRYLAGVAGYVELANLQFVAEAPGRYNLTLENVQLVDPQGNQLGASIANVVLEVDSK